MFEGFLAPALNTVGIICFERWSRKCIVDRAVEMQKNPPKSEIFEMFVAVFFGEYEIENIKNARSFSITLELLLF